MNAVDVLEALAQSTWRTLKSSHLRRIRFGEDAVTSINLNVLAALKKTVVVEDTRANEATKGCDFELWIGSDRHGWRRYAVQAKKLTVSVSRYSTLGHVVAGTKQIDVLERYALANKAAAMYCFYNYSNGAHDWSCALPVDAEQLGCSVTPSVVVRRALSGRGRRNFSWIHQQKSTLPWRCLVKCPLLATPSTGQGQIEDWPSLESHYHERLPLSLKDMLRTGELKELADAEDLFKRDVELWPSWIAVLESDSETE